MVRMISQNIVSVHQMVDEYGYYLIGQIDGHPEARGEVGEKFRKQQTALEAALEAEKQAVREILGVRREMGWKELAFRDAVRQFNYRLLDIVGYDRKSGLYQKYLSGGLTKFGRLSDGKQVEVVSDWVRRLEREDHPDLAGSFRDELSEALAGLEEVREKLAGAEENLRIVREQRDETAERWAKAYRETYFELMVLLGHKKKVVEVFFMKYSGSGARKVRRSSVETVEAGETGSSSEGGVDG